MDHRQITEQIIGCAYTVYNEMGYGFLESVYEKCMLIELANAELRACAQKPITVFYEGHTVGEYVADLIVEDKIIVELKSVRRVVKAHEVQLVNYLTATNIEVPVAQFRRTEGRSEKASKNATSRGGLLT